MAFKLGQAVVEFRAKGVNSVTMAGRKATRTLNEMSRAATGVALSLSAGALTAAGVAAIKLAADVETTRVQFEVLTKSADKANQLLGEITELAASTPFQKMELADAGRKLLAFGSSAEDVVVQLRQIGDIAALTGNSITELAELYGKAQVQGRLFAEDINQLTGRGIPIIQELAKQFGVTDAEVKKLVEDGKVGFANIQQAFADMTSGAGQFAGGMERLSETTAGKLSTLKDNLSEIAVEIGERLLPSVNAFVDAILEAFRPGGPLDNGMTTLIDKVRLLGDLFTAFEFDGVNTVAKTLENIERNEQRRIDEQRRAAIEKGNKNARELIEKREAQRAENIAQAVEDAVSVSVSAQRFGFADLAGSITESSLNRTAELQKEANGHLGDAVGLLGDINNNIENLAAGNRLG